MLGLGGPHLQNQCCSPENRQYIFSICTPLLQLEAKKICSFEFRTICSLLSSRTTVNWKNIKGKKSTQVSSSIAFTTRFVKNATCNIPRGIFNGLAILKDMLSLYVVNYHDKRMTQHLPTNLNLGLFTLERNIVSFWKRTVHNIPCNQSKVTESLSLGYLPNLKLPSVSLN